MKYLALIPLLVSLSNYCHADFVAKVVGVTDGDTITVLDAQKNQVRIRLANIDAPEKNQPFGSRSKQALSDLVFNKYVYIKESGFDKHNRMIATVMKGNDPINRIMVKDGFAWAYKEYLNDPIILNLETYAKKNRVGLWQDPNPIYPSQWRRMQTQK
ncbi:thermonuclease family protein [Acinetobacter nosocomialis]|uniref:thermonuclease family protein n=1 Tax=Acinetobacter nosocomialis TaxID=106654 RepID=UPI0029D9B57E|nr:thermonuclease family protein [Acinetobacter nosocomialis]MDX7882110.1 thermonuclease family protein [Acinetobacter nosocomialis]